MNTRSLIVMCVLASFAGASPAAAIQPLTAIEQAVSDFVHSLLNPADDTEFSIGRLDPRLRLPQCKNPLDARTSRALLSSGPISVEVRCHGEKPWVLYVPVQLDRYADVAVMTAAVPRNAVIGADTLKIERRSVDNRGAAPIVELEQIVGQVATRNLRPGQVVTSNLIKQPRLVRRGDKVILRIGSPSVNVRTQGEALEDGVAGERINVLNLSSERVIEGVVKGVGEVLVAAHMMM